MARKTKTPKGLSIFRRLYAYLGATGLSASLVGRWGITDSDMLFILEIYMFGGIAIQVICDTYYLKEEPLKDLPKDKI